MILSKQDLKEYLKADRAYLNFGKGKAYVVAHFANYPLVQINKYITYLRKQEYYINTANGSKLKGMLGIYYERKKNIQGRKLGIEICPNCFGKGLQIWHGNIVVNASVRAGENCILHGGNCIGNNGIIDTAPRLGNNVDVGYGAILIGDISIADNCVIGASAMVNRSFEEPSSKIVGVPARKIG